MPVFLTVFYLFSTALYGLLSSYAMAPSNMWFFLFVTFSASYIVLNQIEKNWQAFTAGWLFGFGYFTGGLHWIGNALLVDGNPYAWAWPLAVTGLPAVLSFYTALAFYFSKRFFDLQTVKGYCGFVCLLFLSECLRGTLFTGFPWNLFGYTWVEILPMAQIVSLGTIYLLTLLTILWATFPGFLLISTNTAKAKIALSAMLCLSIIGNYAFGAVRLREQKEVSNKTVIRLVQPNILQSEKWDRTKMAAHFQTHLALSRPDESDNENTTTIIVWTETAINPFITENPVFMDDLQALMNTYDGEVYLITGALRYMRENDTYKNSIIVFNKNLEAKANYDKHHLVPFGEYIPFQEWIPIPTVTQFSGFVSGPPPGKIAIEETTSILPLICYEIIFPHLSFFQKDVTFIVNVTNDAWYGDSAGPRQHFTKAVFRAIETSAPVIRVAGTGISAIIDRKGVIIKKIEYGKKQSISYHW